MWAEERPRAGAPRGDRVQFCDGRRLHHAGVAKPTVHADAIRLLTLIKTLWSDGDALLALTCDVLVAVEYNDVMIRRDVKVRPTTILHTLLDDKKPWVHIRLALMGADRSLFGCSCRHRYVAKWSDGVAAVPGRPGQQRSGARRASSAAVRATRPGPGLQRVGSRGRAAAANRDFGSPGHSQTLQFAACSNRLGSADDWASFRTGHRASPAVYWARPCCASSFGPRAAPILALRKVCYGAGARARQCPPGAEVVPGR